MFNLKLCTKLQLFHDLYEKKIKIHLPTPKKKVKKKFMNFQIFHDLYDPSKSDAQPYSQRTWLTRNLLTNATMTKHICSVYSRRKKCWKHQENKATPQVHCYEQQVQKLLYRQFFMAISSQTLVQRPYSMILHTHGKNLWLKSNGRVGQPLVRNTDLTCKETNHTSAWTSARMQEAGGTTLGLASPSQGNNSPLHTTSSLFSCSAILSSVRFFKMRLMRLQV